LQRKQGISKLKYFTVAFAAMFFILNSIMLPIAFKLSPLSGGKEPPASESRVYPGEYQPRAEDALTLLAIDEGEASGRASFLLLRFSPMKEAVMVTALPPDLQIAGEGLEEIYTALGAGRTAEKAAEFLEVPIDRTAVFSAAAVIETVNMFGPVEYTIPYPLQYGNAQEGVYISVPQGRQQIDGRTFLDLIRYPKFKEGYLHKYQLQTHLTAQLLMRAVTPNLAQNAESYFVRIVNLLETNLSRLDYQERADAVAWFCTQPQVRPIYLSGGWEEDRFVPAQESLAAIRENYR